MVQVYDINRDITSEGRGLYCYCHSLHCIMSAAYRNCWLWASWGRRWGLRLLCNPDTMKESGATGRVDGGTAGRPSRSDRVYGRGSDPGVNSRCPLYSRTSSSRCSNTTIHFYHVCSKYSLDVICCLVRKDKKEWASQSHRVYKSLQCERTRPYSCAYV